MRCLILILPFLIIAPFLSNAQSIDLPEQEKGDLLIVTIQKQEVGLGDNDAKIIISTGDETKEIKDLEGFFEKEDVKAVAKILNEVKDKGYTLKESNGGGGSGGDHIAFFNYIFQKK